MHVSMTNVEKLNAHLNIFLYSVFEITYNIKILGGLNSYGCKFSVS